MVLVILDILWYESTKWNDFFIPKRVWRVCLIFDWGIFLNKTRRVEKLWIVELFKTGFTLSINEYEKVWSFSYLTLSLVVTWLILPVVICLFKGLSHACVSIRYFNRKQRTAPYYQSWSTWFLNSIRITIEKLLLILVKRFWLGLRIRKECIY